MQVTNPAISHKHYSMRYGGGLSTAEMYTEQVEGDKRGETRTCEGGGMVDAKNADTYLNHEEKQSDDQWHNKTVLMKEIVPCAPQMGVVIGRYHKCSIHFLRTAYTLVFEADSVLQGLA